MNILVKKARQGDAEAFISLIEQNKQSMYRIAKGMLRNEEDIADAMQDTILNSFEHIGELKHTSYFKTWLIRIMINNCNKILKKRKQFHVVEEIVEVSYNDLNQSNVEFREMLVSLPSDSRTIFQLYYGEGYNAREIGEILNMNENTVKSKLRRGRAELKDQVLAN